MSGRQGQTLTSWLMMIPLLVVPMVAIFGMPKFDLLSATNAEGEELDLELGGEQELEDALPPMPSDQMEYSSSQSAPTLAVASSSTVGKSGSQNEFGWNDPFENPQSSPQNSVRDETSMSRANSSDASSYTDPFASAQGGSATKNPFLQRNENPTSNSPNPQHAGTDAPGYVRSTEQRNGTETDSSAAASAKNLRWREAVVRLNELGVQKYQLSQTDEEFVFQFACDLTHPDNPRITHRFQAEAGEPLQAVAKVIQQVETWSAQINNR